MDCMNSNSKPYFRIGIFGLIALLLIWLGSLKPKVAATGPVVVVGQGSNVTFEPRNENASFWVSRSMGTGTNTVGQAKGLPK